MQASTTPCEKAGPSRGEVRCAHCRALFDDQAWRSMPLAERILADEVGRHVLGWPADECVEVRQCRLCRKPTSARRPFEGARRESA